MKRILFFLLFFCFSYNNFAQTVYEWYQDSIVVFQLKTDAKYVIPSSNHSVDINSVGFVNRLKDKYGIYDFHHFFPDFTDDALRNTYQLKFTEIEKVDELIRDLENVPYIEYAEKKELHVTFLTPNDLGPNTATGTGMWHLWRIQAQEAWDLSTGSSNVVVAVTDDAIKIDHPDLASKMVPGNDATNQNSTNPMPCGGNNGNHGTHVAGTVGAATDNGIGVASIGWDISIMPVKIGRCSDGALTAGYEGIAWAANNGADIINMSWGGGGSSNFGLNIVNNAHNQGAILVAAAGNSNSTNLFYPAGYNNVIAVASTTTNDSRSNFSQYGNWIDISAPGSAIRSTWASNNAYNRIQGTSMASPNVAGLLGLMKSYAPTASNADLVQCLYSSADPVTSNVTQMGAGRINAFQALQCLSAFAFTTDVGITEIVDPSSTVCGNEFTPQIRLRNFGSDTVTSVPIVWEWNGVQNTFQWTGVLSTGQSELITLPTQTSTGGTFTFSAVSNLLGDQNPLNDTITKTFNVDPNGVDVDFTLITDCYGSEITWNIVDDQNNVVVSGGPYTNVAGGATYVKSFCLEVGCYTFTINDSYGDGMYGSQWQNCSVDGDYFATTAAGVPLFEMTAPNADFGNSTSHQFCVIDNTIENDAGISEVVSPSGSACSPVIEPQVRIRNYGSEPLTSAVINYNIGGANQTFSWSGNLTTGQSQVVSLPAITSATGLNTFLAYTSLPNGLTDDNPLNDSLETEVIIYDGGISLPFTEDFESNSFLTNLWTIDNPDNNITWDIVTVAGNNPGDKAARMNFYNYTQSSQRDGLISPLLDLTGYDSVTLDFEHAYRRFVVQGSQQPAPTDSIILYVSIDCGSSWQRIYEIGEDGTGTMATNTATSQPFTPAQVNHWCLEKVNIGGNLVGADCISLNLDAFIGNQVLIKFEGYNAGTQGNNLFIDNINITGVQTQTEPTPDFSVANPGICVGETVEFNDASTPSASSWFWEFPGGTPATSNAQNPVVTYSAPGEYDVILTATNVAGSNTTVFSDAISVESQPVFDIIALGPTNLCSSESVTLESTGNTDWQYTWLLNGSPIGTNSSTHDVFSAGDYTLEAINANGCENTSSNTITISYFNDPPASITPGGPHTVCPSDNLVLEAPQGTGLTYVWRRNGNPIPGATGQTFEPLQTGNYTVEVTESSNNCSKISSVVTVTINSSPTANIIPPSVNSICQGQTIVLNTAPQAGVTYQWQFNGADIPGATGSSFTVGTEGQYTVVVTNLNSSCSATSSAIEIIESGDPPNVQLQQFGTVSICQGDQVEIEAFSTDATQYQWQLNGINIIGETNSSITVTESGTYNIVASNGCGSTTSSTVDVEVNPLPVAEINILGESQTFCPGDTAFLASSVTGLQYQWYLNNNPISGATEPVLEATVGGQYRLLVVDNNSGCEKMSSITNIQFTNPPAPNIDVDENILTVDASGATQWYFEGDVIDGETGQQLIAEKSGEYTVVVTLENGCTVSSSVIVNIVSVEMLTDESVFILFPNPIASGEILTIELENLNHNQIYLSIKNVLGQEMLRKKTDAQHLSRGIKMDFPAGTYYIKLHIDNDLRISPLIIY